LTVLNLLAHHAPDHRREMPHVIVFEIPGEEL
jgi:hypothetical protein